MLYLPCKASLSYSYRSYNVLYPQWLKGSPVLHLFGQFRSSIHGLMQMGWENFGTNSHGFIITYHHISSLSGLKHIKMFFYQTIKYIHVKIAEFSCSPTSIQNSRDSDTRDYITFHYITLLFLSGGTLWLQAIEKEVADCAPGLWINKHVGVFTSRME